MHFLITRPEPDAWKNKSQLENLGFEVTSAPLLEIVFDDIPPDLFDDASGVIVTSKNALRSLALSGLADKVKPLQVYAVGEATAEMAVDLKLRNITAGRGTAAELVPAIAERQASRRGAVIHLAGDHLAFDMAKALGEKGIKVSTQTVYRSVAAEKLPTDAVAWIKNGKINAVTLMSPRTASTWVKLAEKHGIAAEAARLVHLCLSDAVARALGPSSIEKIETASQPNEQEMLDLARKVAAEFKPS